LQTPKAMIRLRRIDQGDFLRHSEDPRDFNVNRPTGPVDEFVLRFEKPR